MQSVMSSKNIDFIRIDSDQSDSVTVIPAGCLTRGCQPNGWNWITANFSICVLTACLQTHRAKISKQNIKSRTLPSLFSHCRCTLHCSQLHKWPNFYWQWWNCFSGQTWSVQISEEEQLNKNEEKCPSCLQLYNVKHWSHVNKNKLR